jgi:hypothetical protein
MPVLPDEVDEHRVRFKAAFPVPHYAGVKGWAGSRK